MRSISSKFLFTFIPAILLTTFTIVYAQQSNTYYGVNLDTVKAQKYDMGKMWTFENPPLDYFEETYGFRPSEDWLNKVRMSALKFANWCSSSFVSSDGLIMTNHHCVRGSLASVEKEGENLLRDGFFAETPDEERVMPGIFVNQLVLIEDVTDRVLSATDFTGSDEEKIEALQKTLNEIEDQFSDEHKDLNIQVVSLYNGGRYSVYGYKRYSDVRLVFVPDLHTAKLGGDYDNFTYPRYGLDCAFLRVYDENGKPLKTDYYFTWSQSGPAEGEPLFVVGNPGSTDRINTIAQIEYMRDIQYPMVIPLLKELYSITEKKVEQTNAEDYKLIAQLYSIGNSLKVYEGTYKGLLDPVLIARKKDFEKNFKNAVKSDPELSRKYLHIWDEIEESRKEAASFAKELFAYNLSPFFSPKYYFIARDLVELAEQLTLPDSLRDEFYKGDELQNTINSVFPDDFDEQREKQLLELNIRILNENLPEDSQLRQKMLGDFVGKEALDYLMNKSEILSKESVIELANSGADAILNSEDPFIYFILNTRDRLEELKTRSEELQRKEEYLNQQLGRALFEVYGTSIPPDATFTLRIADGVMKGYNYNGTVAPPKTTFYGSLDRYYSFDKQFPFNLPDYWENLPPEFDLSTPLNFVSTNDIIGGNSGSPVINKNAEIVGLAFDGNIESLPNRFIYTTEANRTVSVHSEGMIEAITDLYNAKRLSEELRTGSIPDEFRK
ncbi:MAG: S46 family peptidase [Ignavibacteriaceae bacterium]